MKQVTEGEWLEIASPYPLCTLPFALSKLASKFDFKLTTYSENGLGELNSAIV
ncbi:hypothetical protein [Kangiella sediminilitoris]|uniref:hypothetical protein n=1 Tax=Kangiella sediminilitoris TaxID=1144748 RepID=UPI0012EAE71C|nr:hypothetical protein [Kangiella sediminilitoris]